MTGKPDLGMYISVRNILFWRVFLCLMLLGTLAAQVVNIIDYREMVRMQKSNRDRIETIEGKKARFEALEKKLAELEYRVRNLER